MGAVYRGTRACSQTFDVFSLLYGLFQPKITSLFKAHLCSCMYLIQSILIMIQFKICLDGFAVKLGGRSTGGAASPNYYGHAIRFSRRFAGGE